MFFSKTSLGELTNTLVANSPQLDQPHPILVIKGVRNEKQLKAFFSGELPKDSYGKYSIYFQRNPLYKNIISLTWKKGRNIYGIAMDINDHLVTIAGMVRCRKIFVVHEDDMSKTSHLHFDIGSAVDHFEAELKESLLIQVLKKKLKESGQDPSGAAALVPKLWAGFEEAWDDFILSNE